MTIEGRYSGVNLRRLDQRLNDSVELAGLRFENVKWHGEGPATTATTFRESWQAEEGRWLSFLLCRVIHGAAGPLPPDATGRRKGFSEG